MDWVPLVEIRLYDAGQGDPYATDRGCALYDTLAQTWPAGSFSANAQGVPYLQYLPEIGLVCRAFVEETDTLVANWTTAGGGIWESRKPATGGTEVTYRLAQISAAPNISWSAESSYELPADVAFAAIVTLYDTPAGHDSALLPPYVQIEFGEGWAVRVTRERGAHLLHEDAEVMELSWPWGLEEVPILVRPARGGLWISLDGGNSGSYYRMPDGTAITLPAATITLRGQGMACSFGLHRVHFYEGAYTSPTVNTFVRRLIPAATVTPTGREPEGTSLALVDLTGADSALAQWRATLTPGTAFRDGRYWYRSPELYAVCYRLPVLTAGGAGTYTTPWSGQEVEVTIEKPYALDEARCAIRVMRSPVAFTRDLRRRKVMVRLGKRHADLSDEWWTAFVGYIARVRPARDQFGRVALDIECDTLADWLKAAEWGPLHNAPLGGLTVNAAGDAILASEGLGAGYRNWHARGAALTLPAGLAEHPCEWLAPQERKWETLTRIFGYAGLEVAVADDGTLVSLPRNYVEAAVSREYQDGAYSDLEEMPLSIAGQIDYTEMRTAVAVEGVDAGSGRPVVAWAQDAAAEADPTSERFAGRRENVTEEIPGTTTPGIALARAGGLALSLFALHQEPDLLVLADPGLQRRARVALYDADALGIPDGSEGVVLSLRHRYGVDPETGGMDLRTTAGVRVL